MKAAIRLGILRLIGARPFEASAGEQLASTRVLTIDVFDTLVTRIVLRPSDTFLLCGIQLQERALVVASPAAWADIRHRAEDELRRTAFPHEVSLDEIYQRLVDTGLIAVPHRQAAYEIERNMERLLSRPIAATIAAVNAFVARGGTALVLSDTPLPRDDVWRLLEQAGLSLDEDFVRTSSLCGKTKRSGDLFHKTVAELGGRAGAVLHVGDDVGSDVLRARRAGLRAAPYLAGRLTRFETKLRDCLQKPDLLGSIVAGSARAVRLGRCLASPHEQSIWNLSAGVTGPLLFSFVAWILGEAVRCGQRTLYFFSRDGEILLQIARELQARHAYPVECRYLYVSRRSLHLPAITEIGDAERAWIFDGATVNDLEHFLARLDITVAELHHRLPADSPIRHLAADATLTPADVQALEECLSLTAVQELILERAALRRDICLAYLTAEGMLAPGPIGFVDIGWKGRLQRSLCRILATRAAEFADRVHGFYIDLDSRPADAGTFSVFSELCPTKAFSWARRGSLFEIICAANHGTVTGYARAADGAAGPTFAPDFNRDAEAWGVTVQQQAVVEFTREVLHGMHLAQLNPIDHVTPLARAAKEVARMFVTWPTNAEAETFGRFMHSSDERHERHEPIAAPIDFWFSTLRKRLDPKHRFQPISYWPEASVVRSVPRWLRGPMLSMLGALPGRRR